MVSSTPDGEPSAPDSNWWYVVLAVPVYFVLASVAGGVLGVAAFVAALTGVASGPTPELVGVGFAGAVAVIVLLALLGLVLSLLFPVAVYFDAEAVAAAGGDWRPDPELYGLLGLVGVVAQPLQVALGAYYLYKRHDSVGVP